jgi:hypothetical protein
MADTLDMTFSLSAAAIDDEVQASAVTMFVNGTPAPSCAKLSTP